MIDIVLPTVARPLIASFLVGNGEDESKTRLIDHIVQFSLNGIGAGKEEDGK